MKYTEKYPIDSSPGGDKGKDAVLKNRKEIMAVAQVMSEASTGGGGGQRQRVLHGSTVNGAYNFLTGNGLTVTIDGSIVPIYVTFADGFDDSGAVDYLEKITTKVSAWSLPASGTSYLYVDRSSTGALSYGSTSSKPLYQTAVPSAGTDKHYYSPIDQKMYCYNGSAWKAVRRVFIASVTTTSSAVSKIEYLNPDAGSVSDDDIGDFTIDDTQAASVDTGKLSAVMNWLAHEIKAIKGAGWRGAVANSLVALADKIGNCYTKTESDDRYINTGGDKMTGTLGVTAFEFTEGDGNRLTIRPGGNQEKGFNIIPNNDIANNIAGFLDSGIDLYRPVSITDTLTVAKNLSVGGYVTGDVSFTGSLNFNTTNTGLKTIISGKMAGNDIFRICVLGASDAGTLCFDTGDNGNEDIYFRQYTGVFDTLVRQAAILDSDGNTQFPGTVRGDHFKFGNGAEIWVE